MKDKLTKEQLSIIRRIAGGTILATSAIRTAAHNIVINFASDTDYELIINYINNE